MSTTPNMSLVLPVVQLTIGPDWASELNTALELVDSHDHTSGNGAAIPTAALGINGDLSFNSFAATSLDRTSYDDQIAALASVRSIYAVNGDLYYTNTAGDQVQITAGNSIAGTPGAITGLGDGGSSGVYYDATDTLSFYYNTTAQAKLDISTIQIHPYEVIAGPTPVPHPEYIALVAPTSLAASYNITLPVSLPTQTGILGMDPTGQITKGLGDGTSTAPSMYFTGDPDTGVYRPSSDNLAITTGGTARFTVGLSGITNTLPLYNPIGSAAAPTYSFAGDLDTGIYAPAANQVGVATAGGLRLTVSNTFILGSVSYQGPSGSAAAPAYSFSSDTDTGMYSAASNKIGFTVAGAVRATIDSHLEVNSNTVGAPGYSFVGDSDTGIYNPSPNVLGFVTNGSSQMTLTANGLQFGGNGELKWKVFSGSLAGSANTTIATGATIVSVIGYSSRNGSGSNMVPMTSTGFSGTGIIGFTQTTGTTTSVGIANDSASTNTYKIIVFTQ